MTRESTQAMFVFVLVNPLQNSPSYNDKGEEDLGKDRKKIRNNPVYKHFVLFQQFVFRPLKDAQVFWATLKSQ